LYVLCFVPYEFMSGHSHWAGIKHRKEINDSKRAKIFTRLAKPIVLAAREGGENPETNFKLRLAIEKARQFNMPKDNIEKAVKRGTGEIAGAEIEEALYEAVGPGGVMIIIKTTTDNRNRTVSEIKHILSKNKAKLGEQGSTLWNFNQVGLISLEKNSQWEENELIAIDSGAIDVKTDKEKTFVYTKIQDLKKIQTIFSQKKLPLIDFQIFYLPKNIIQLNSKNQLDYDKLLEDLEDQEDVEEIFDNL